MFSIPIAGSSIQRCILCAHCLVFKKKTFQITFFKTKKGIDVCVSCSVKSISVTFVSFL